MSKAIEKYAKLVDLLLERTKRSKIPWEYDTSRDTVTVWNGDVLLALKKDQDENYEDLFTLSLINRSGTFLEGFNDVTLNGVHVDEEDDNYFIRLRDLHEIAMRQATGADKALDDFISAVQNDNLDVPF